MSDNKIVINTQGGTVITGGSFSNVQFVAQQNVVYNTEQKCANDNGDIDEVAVVLDNVQDDTENTLMPGIPHSVESCFYFANEYVREIIDAIVSEFYTNRHTDLAMIEVTLFDHGQLRKRNLHKPFVRALVDWGILVNDVDIDKICSGMASKFRSLPQNGYRSWGSNHTNERELCRRIGEKLPESMKYKR